jgi:hypothetical protein
MERELENDAQLHQFKRGIRAWFSGQVSGDYNVEVTIDNWLGIDAAEIIERSLKKGHKGEAVISGTVSSNFGDVILEVAVADKVSKYRFGRSNPLTEEILKQDEDLKREFYEWKRGADTNTYEFEFQTEAAEKTIPTAQEETMKAEAAPEITPMSPMKEVFIPIAASLAAE